MVRYLRSSHSLQKEVVFIEVEEYRREEASERRRRRRGGKHRGRGGADGDSSTQEVASE